MFGDYQANTAMPNQLYYTQAYLFGLIRVCTFDKKCLNIKVYQKKTQYYCQNTTNSTFKS